MWLILVSNFLAVNIVITYALVHQHFMIMDGYSVNEGRVLRIIQRADVSAVLCSSLCTTNCGLVVYNQVQKTCSTFQDRFQEVNMTTDSACAIIYKDDAVVHGNLTMVFRVQSGQGSRVVDYWSATGTHDDYPVHKELPFKCLRLNKYNSCRKYFRSKILDDWHDIEEVRFSLYNNGEEVKYILFNGTGTNNQSWFSQTRVISSSWELLSEPMEHFSVKGYTQPRNTYRRSFNIFGPLSGCNLDQAYTFISEGPKEYCDTSWNIPEDAFPAFVYSKTAWPTVLHNKEFGLADVMAVFVKFKAK